MKLQRYGSRAVKVFIRRAIKAGWSEYSIRAAIRFGIQHFRPF